MTADELLECQPKTVETLNKRLHMVLSLFGTGVRVSTLEKRGDRLWITLQRADGDKMLFDIPIWRLRVSTLEMEQLLARELFSSTPERTGSDLKTAPQEKES